MIANLSALIPQYKSKAEEDYAAYGPILIGDEFGEKVVLTMYEPMTFRLPGGKYTPDFLHLLQSGTHVFVEVKGSKKQKNYRDARSKLRAAAEMYSFYSWCMVIGGNIERI